MQNFKSLDILKINVFDGTGFAGQSELNCASHIN